MSQRYPFYPAARVQSNRLFTTTGGRMRQIRQPVLAHPRQQLDERQRRDHACAFDLLRFLHPFSGRSHMTMAPTPALRERLFQTPPSSSSTNTATPRAAGGLEMHRAPYCSHPRLPDSVPMRNRARSFHGRPMHGPAKKPKMSCSFLDSTDEVNAWREDRRSGVVCASLGMFGDDLCRTRSLAGPCRTRLR